TDAQPKRPMPKVIAQMIRNDAKNAPAIPKVGWQRAVSHNSSGSTRAPGLNVIQDPVGWITTYKLVRDMRASAPTPSIHSPRVGGLRHAWPSPIMSGATTTIPTPSDKNHARQTSQYDAAV